MRQEGEHCRALYSLGEFIYNLATAQMPFVGASRNDVLRQQIYERPRAPHRLKKLPQRIPLTLDRLIMRCLAKKPADRPQSMQEIQPELAMIAETLRDEIARRSRRLWRTVVAATTILALLIGSTATDVAIGRSPGQTMQVVLVSATQAIRSRFAMHAAALALPDAQHGPATAPIEEAASLPQVADPSAAEDTTPEFQPDERPAAVARPDPNPRRGHLRRHRNN